MDSLSKALRSRWKAEYSKHGIPAALRPHFDKMLELLDDIPDRRKALHADVRLSDVGRKEELSKFATSKAREIARAGVAVQAAQESMRAERAKLTPTVKDKGDLAAAALRQEIRASLRSMKAGDILSLVNEPSTDTIVLEAIFEGPTFLTGIDAATRDHALRIAVERTAGPALQAVNDQADAVDLVATTMRGVRTAVGEALGIRDDQVENWLQQVAPMTDETKRSEADKYRQDAVSAGAVALPLGARMSLVETLLAANVVEAKAA